MHKWILNSVFYDQIDYDCIYNYSGLEPSGINEKTLFLKERNVVNGSPNATDDHFSVCSWLKDFVHVLLLCTVHYDIFIYTKN